MHGVNRVRLSARGGSGSPAGLLCDKNRIRNGGPGSVNLEQLKKLESKAVACDL